MGDLPAIGDPISLRDKAELSYISRVEDLTDDHILVARPADLRAALVYDIGLELDVIWTLETGIHVLPTQLVDTSTERNIRLWHLEPTGGAWTEQRRDYVRVGLTGTVMISANEKAPADAPAWTLGPIAGTFIDISEVALQAVIAPPADSPQIRERTAVRCQFTLGGYDYDLEGAIIIIRPGDAMREQRIVVRFAATKSVSDAIRKEIFGIQLARRRNG